MAEIGQFQLKTKKYMIPARCSSMQEYTAQPTMKPEA
jgi:hypothetical protein